MDDNYTIEIKEEGRVLIKLKVKKANIHKATDLVKQLVKLAVSVEPGETVEDKAVAKAKPTVPKLGEPPAVLPAVPPEVKKRKKRGFVEF